VTDELIATIRQALEGYAQHGAQYWPAATAFLLIALKPDDMTSANATIVCRACVAMVAKTALTVMDERAATGSYPIHSPGGAVHVCGPAPIYDLIGVGELPLCMGCAECGTHLGCGSGCSACTFATCPCRCRSLGHQPTEALIFCGVCDADMRSSDSEAIAREVTNAALERRIINDGCARAIAAQWFDNFYGGMVTHSYAFVSTGTIPPDLRDAWALLHITDWSIADVSHPNHGELLALDRYLKHHGPRGPVPGWVRVWVRP
jgi:hypothetical protein